MHITECRLISLALGLARINDSQVCRLKNRVTIILKVCLDLAELGLVKNSAQFRYLFLQFSELIHDLRVNQIGFPFIDISGTGLRKQIRNAFLNNAHFLVEDSGDVNFLLIPGLLGVIGKMIAL